MVIDVKMCRFDNVPWGFRLVGGADYDYPLTVVKVTEGSIAEEAGLCVDDVIVRINDTAAAPLTHDEANQHIRSCGSVFFFGVYRENEDEVYTGPTKFPVKPAINEVEVVDVEEPQLELEPAIAPTKPPVEDFRDNVYIPELPERPCSALSKSTEIKLVEEEIAAVLSGESEVLQDHNVLGIFPKPGVCMSSDVLRSLNEEAVKTKLEKDKELRKWSTFLQKPNRPIPLSKQQLEAERRAANAYKVVITKSASPQSKTATATESEKAVEKEATPPPEAEPQAANEEAEVKEPAKEEDDDEPLPTDSEVPNLEEVPQADESNANGEQPAVDVDAETPAANGGHEGIEKDADTSENAERKEETTSDVAAESNEAAVDGTDMPTTTTTPTTETANAESTAKTEEELILEKQLADVQKQLVALSSLPSTIQTTLDAVTKQLAELLPTFKLQQIEPEKEVTAEAEAEACVTQAEEGSALVATATDDAEANDVQQSNGDQHGEEERTQVGHDANCDLEVEFISRTKGGGLQKDAREPEQGLRKAKRHDVIEELEEHLERKNNPKRSKRAFGPLTPSSERPVVLPGGRRWYRPKDAYNDEFIAETLSAQAELITGTTLGINFESPLLGYDSGVNFMKYQKPDRKIDLNRSEVYKVIHHLDRQPVRGIEVRAPKVAAESDIREMVQS